MLSVVQLAEKFNSLGFVFRRDPWTGEAFVDNWSGVPDDLRNALESRWGDLEAVIREERPPRSVVVECAERLLRR